MPSELWDEPWEPIEWGRWAYADHIMLGEARAVIRLLQIVGADAASHARRRLSLEDNQAVSGSMAKGRSSALALNYLLRRRAALGLATDAQTILPWTESAKMPADDLSRRVPDGTLDA